MDTGFATERLLTMRLFPPESNYPDDLRVAAFYEDLLQRVRSLPGVKDAAAASDVPIGGRNGGTVIQIEGGSSEPEFRSVDEFRVVSPSYFRTMGIRLLRGRFLEDSDRERARPVAVINETLARAYWPNDDPIGRRFRLLDAPPERARTVFLTVVGVVADAKNNGLTEAAANEAYVPMRQRPVAIAGMGFPRQMALAIRTSVEPMNLTNAIRQEVWAIDRGVPITMRERWSRFWRRSRRSRASTRSCSEFSQPSRSSSPAWAFTACCRIRSRSAQRDWDSHRPGRPPRRRVEAGRQAGNAPRAARRGDRPGGLVRIDSLDDRFAVRSERDRPGDICPNCSDFDARGVCGLLPAGAAGDEG